MPYAQFDDNFADHPKVAGLSDAAFRLHVSGILYCSRHLTDGVIPAGEVPRLVRRFRKSSLDELTAFGPKGPLWHASDEDTYYIHDYLDWNASRAEVQDRREHARKAAQKRWSR